MLRESYRVRTAAETVHCCVHATRPQSVCVCVCALHIGTAHLGLGVVGEVSSTVACINYSSTSEAVEFLEPRSSKSAWTT